MRAALFIGPILSAALLFGCDAQPKPVVVVEPVEVPQEPPLPPTTPEPDPEAAADPTPSTASPTRLVLVTLDGVRWEDVFDPEGNGLLMPNLDRLVRERGVALGGQGCENDVRASGPNFVSLPGYMEMFGGGKAKACTHNYCAPIDTKTVIDDARAAVNAPSEVAVFASWSRYADAVTKQRGTIMLSAGSRPTNQLQLPALAKEDKKLKFYLEMGGANAGYPGHGDYRPDMHTARIALHYLETQQPRVLVMGLGDADEHAHRGDIPSYRRAIQRADATIGEIERTLERMGDEAKHTAVLITTDHGRAASLRSHGATYPESQRVFVAAFGEGIARRGVTCTSQPLRLAHLAGAMRAILGIGEDQDASSPLAREIVAAQPQL